MIGNLGFRVNPIGTIYGIQLVMLVLTLILFLVGTALSNGIEGDKEYTYLVRSRTLTALHGLSDQYSGVLMKAILKIQPTGPEEYQGKLSQPQYARIHKSLPNGWDSELPDDTLQLRELPLSGKPFQIRKKHGTIREVIVERDVPTWEVNFLKSIASQLQVDTQGENAIRRESSQIPEDGNQFSAIFQAMEDSVTGRCETLYEIAPLPREVIRDEPDLVNFPDLQGPDGDIIAIIKTRNYSNCDHRVGYHFGFTGKTNWEPGSSDNDKFLSRYSISKIIISGKLTDYVIQSSVTTNQVTLSPHMHDDENRGIVVSRMNLTLVGAKPSPKADLPRLQNPQSTGSLVYNPEDPLADGSERTPRPPGESETSDENGIQDSDESGESMEGQDYLHLKHTLDSAQQIPLGLFSGARKDKVTESVKRLSEQIGKDTQEPNSMPSEDTLEKFLLLTRYIRVMSRDELSKVAREFEPSRNEVQKWDEAKRNTWAAFRDAVAQVGTGPALLTIKRWIEEKRIEGYEAAQVVAVAGKTARVPNQEYMDAFFSLITQPEVMKQQHLNNSALMAFTDLIRYSQVNKRAAHNRYPVHSYGRLHGNMHRDYIPHLESQLREAIEARDSPKVQSYTRALGNVGHPRILAIFEPYLEGKKPITDFQRQNMVVSLDKLSTMYPRVARSVLYKIYLNRFETHEARCVAVYMLMKTNPPLGMLRRMADFTNFDYDENVNSAVKSAIESASRLKAPHLQDLARKAKIAKEMLSPYDYSMRYTQILLRDFEDDEMNLAYKAGWLSMGSRDSDLPKMIAGTLETTYAGFRTPTSALGAFVSSLEELGRLFDNHWKKDDDDHAAEKQKVPENSPEKISQTLKIKSDEPSPLEGHVFLKSKYGHMYFPFDSHMVKRIPEMLREATVALVPGHKFNCLKMASYDIALSFPVETGLPFFYTLNVPILSKMTGRAELKSIPESEKSGDEPYLDLKTEAEIVGAIKLQGRLGFVVPFEEAGYISGVDKSLQAYLPIKSDVSMDWNTNKMRIKIEPLATGKEYKIFNFNSKPYTSRYSSWSLTPLSRDKDTHPIISGEMRKVTMGGEEVRIQSEDDVQAPHRKRMKSMDPISLLAFPFARVHARYIDTNVFFKPTGQSNRAIVVTIAYKSDVGYEDKPRSSPSSTPQVLQVSDKEPGSAKRMNQFLKEASRGLSSAKAEVIDLGVEIIGEEKGQATFTLARGSSLVDARSQLYVFTSAGLPQSDVNVEVCLAGVTKWQKLPEFDIKKILKKGPEMSFEADIRYGEDCAKGGHMTVESKFHQSEEYREELSKIEKCDADPENTVGLTVCQKARKEASILDTAWLKLKFDEMSESVKNRIHTLLEMVTEDNEHAQIDTSEPSIETNDRIEMSIKATPDQQRADIRIKVPQMDVDFLNVNYNFFDDEEEEDDPVKVKDDDDEEEEFNDMFEGLDYAHCVLDKTKLETFDEMVYRVKLGNCWHVMMTTFPKQNPDKATESLPIRESTKTSIMARDMGENKRQVKIIFGEKQIRLYPSPGGVPTAEIDGLKVQYANGKSYQSREDKKVVFEVIQLPEENALEIVSEKYGIHVVYDGFRVKVKASDEYKNSVRGLCGTYDHDWSNEFTAPQNCVLQKAEDFQASYALTEAECEGDAVQKAQKAQKATCEERKPRLTNVISDDEAGREPRPTGNWGYHKGAASSESNKKCTRFRTKVVREDGRICFSVKPLPSCASNCQVVATKQKSIPMHCSKKSSAAESLADRIEQGANPDLSQKEVNEKMTFKVPIKCSA